ncbi:hypothetical protein [Nonomuraea sp. 3N208]|uniref:hypothetical protein n=1 Tax=Nonomuraea sp. 3N208 TaxID=3457421 RepID=UPI003FCE4415
MRQPYIDAVSHTSKSKLIVPPAHVVAVALNVGLVVINCRPLSGDIEVIVGAGGFGHGPTNIHPASSSCGGYVLRLEGMFWVAIQIRPPE